MVNQHTLPIHFPSLFDTKPPIFSFGLCARQMEAQGPLQLLKALLTGIERLRQVNVCRTPLIFKIHLTRSPTVLYWYELLYEWRMVHLTFSWVKAASVTIMVGALFCLNNEDI